MLRTVFVDVLCDTFTERLSDGSLYSDWVYKQVMLSCVAGYDVVSAYIKYRVKNH